MNIVPTTYRDSAELDVLKSKPSQVLHATAISYPSPILPPPPPTHHATSQEPELQPLHANPTRNSKQV
jgi:hypothetical protein